MNAKVTHKEDAGNDMGAQGLWIYIFPTEAFFFSLLSSMLSLSTTNCTSRHELRYSFHRSNPRGEFEYSVASF